MDYSLVNRMARMNHCLINNNCKNIDVMAGSFSINNDEHLEGCTIHADFSVFLFTSYYISHCYKITPLKL